jgi:hypothetical protein
MHARLGSSTYSPRSALLRYLYDFGDGWEHTIKIECHADPDFTDV